jgi:hypothetical protein
MTANRAEEIARAAPLEAVDAKRAWMAVAAAWVFPGLGHILLGRVRRGILFGVLLLFCFGLGLGHDGRLALRDARQPFLTTMQVVANLGMGPLDLVARWGVYGGMAYKLPSGSRSGTEHPYAEIFRERTRSPLSIYGTAYLWTAGLMNLLLLFDVWDIAMGRKP